MDYSVRERSKKFDINVSIDRQYSVDALRAILSTILFHRLFGTLVPTIGEAVDVTYPIATHPETEDLVKQRAKELALRLRESSTNSQAVQLQFFSRRVKKSAWFAKTHNFCWETWEISLNIEGTRPVDIAQQSLARSHFSKELQRALMEVVVAVDANKDHIPPITTTDVSPFLYEITFL